MILSGLEEQLLNQLADSEGNILENQTLISSLNEAKEKSSSISQSLAESKIIQDSLDREREKYSLIATRGSSLYFVIQDLKKLNNMYEFSITGAFAFAAAYLLSLRKYDLRWLGLFISAAVLLTLGTAITLLYRDSAPLMPALQSAWLVIHVVAAIISGGVFLLSNIVAGAYLYLDSAESKGGRPLWAHRIPSLDVLDQLSYRLVAFVFPLWTFSVIAGAIWAEAAWGRYWGWDPKETWAFITWVAYAAYLHARVTAGWRGRRAAWLCIFAGSTFLFNYIYINIWGTGKHTYSGL
jgi:cytochrome c-type biogenesis protein CcsB